HALQNPVAPGQGALRIAERVVGRGCLGQAGDHRQLRQVQVVQGLAVVDLGGGLDAVGAAAEEDLVDVQFEDVFFGQDVLDLQGQDYLVEFTEESLVLTEEEVARHLHGDGGAAGAYLAVAHQFAGGTRQALEVNAVVTEEAFVFGGGQGLDEILRDLLELDRG